MSGHADTIRSYLDGFVDGRDIHDFPTFDETTAALDALLAENQRLREAAHYVRATLRGMLSDPNVTRSIDLRPEIEMLDRALAEEKVPDAMP